MQLIRINLSPNRWRNLHPSNTKRIPFKNRSNAHSTISSMNSAKTIPSAANINAPKSVTWQKPFPSTTSSSISRSYSITAGKISALPSASSTNAKAWRRLSTVSTSWKRSSSGTPKPMLICRSATCCGENSPNGKLS